MVDYKGKAGNSVNSRPRGRPKGPAAVGPAAVPVGRFQRQLRLHSQLCRVSQVCKPGPSRYSHRRALRFSN